MTETTVSRHFFRRTARRREQRLQHEDIHGHYRVEKAERGPYLWRVVRVHDEGR